MPLRIALVLFLVLGFAPAASSEQGIPPAMPPGAEEVTFDTEDGVSLVADLYRSADPQAPVVVLLHEHRKNRTDWSPLIPRLIEAKFNVVALDLRGHGGSTRQVQEGREGVLDANAVPLFLAKSLITRTPADIAATLEMLEANAIQNQRFAMVGAGYGASAAILSGVEFAGRCRLMVLLSPVAGSFGVDAYKHAKLFPGNMMLIVDAADPTAVPSAQRIVKEHPRGEELVVLPEAGRGTHILLSHPDINARIVEFLKTGSTSS